MITTKDLIKDIKLSRINKCLVVTSIPCNTPYIDKESPNGCLGCGMMDWLTFATEKECNDAYMKQHPNEFDSNGKYIGI